MQTIIHCLPSTDGQTDRFIHRLTGLEMNRQTDRLIDRRHRRTQIDRQAKRKDKQGCSPTIVDVVPL